MYGLNLVDLQKRVTPGETGHLKIAEILNKSIPILKDAPWMPTNKTDTRTTSVRAGLPKSQRRRANRGTRISKSVVTQNEEATTTRESWGENDVNVINSFPDKKMARAAESMAHIEGMGQDIALDLWYGNRTADPDNINGLTERYNRLTGNIAQNVINAGGTGADNASIYLIKWVPEKVGLIYPKRAEGQPKGAIYHKDLDIETVNKTETDAAGNVHDIRMLAYRDMFTISAGWCIADWRCVVRICNIDVSDLISNSVAGTSTLRYLMTQALHRMPMGDGMMRFYMNRTVNEYLDIERLKQVGEAGMTYKEVDGMELSTFRNVPIRIDDTLLTTEGLVA